MKNVIQSCNNSRLVKLTILLIVFLTQFLFYALPNDTDQAINLKKAIQQEDLETINILADKKIDPNTYGANNKTSLMLASRENDLDLVKKLINIGADVNLVDDKGKTAFHYAAFTQSLETYKYLARLYQSTDIKDKYGNTPLLNSCYSVKDFDLDFFLFAVAQSEKPYATDNKGRCVSHLLMKKHPLDIVLPALIQSGYDLTTRDDDMKTPLDVYHSYDVEIGTVNRSLDSLLSSYSLVDRPAVMITRRFAASDTSGELFLQTIELGILNENGTMFEKHYFDHGNVKWKYHNRHKVNYSYSKEGRLVEANEIHLQLDDYEEVPESVAGTIIWTLERYKYKKGKIIFFEGDIETGITREYSYNRGVLDYVFEIRNSGPDNHYHEYYENGVLYKKNGWVNFTGFEVDFYFYKNGVLSRVNHYFYDPNYLNTDIFKRAMSSDDNEEELLRHDVKPTDTSQSVYSYNEKGLPISIIRNSKSITYTTTETFQYDERYRITGRTYSSTRHPYENTKEEYYYF
jgi:hypothetical protein